MTNESPIVGAVAIEEIYPQVDHGAFAVKRTVGEVLEVWADIFKPGHDKILGVLEHRSTGSDAWEEGPMEYSDNDRWVGKFKLGGVGEQAYRISAWTDLYGTALEATQKWLAAGEKIATDLSSLVGFVDEAAGRAKGKDASDLSAFSKRIKAAPDESAALQAASEARLVDLMREHGRRDDVTRSREFRVVVDKTEAASAAWYEMFHRSQGVIPGKSATFGDCAKRLPELKAMGFDVVYLPPIHPIGKKGRRGRDNSPEVGPDDPGSPWAIGSKDGGHDAVNPDLGSMEDFQEFVSGARTLGMEVAIDLAFQCSPDHPYVKEHPEWFYHRKDGSIRYAENPPKKYYDIYPLAFDGPDRKGLWDELKRVTLFWISKGVTTFRVDNPHTKPSAFWQWLISDIKKDYPDVVFLAEAFTAPKPMRWLSKIGFSQSYTYFTWKNTKPELEQFLGEFVLSDVAEYYRGNFFTNTPDILHVFLQKGGRPAFKIRLVLAATLSSLYGIYNGYELCENTPKEEGSEEYLHSEKYEFKVRNWDAPGNIKSYISTVNRIRKDNPALQLTRNLRLLRADDENVIFYAKWTQDRSNVIAVAVNLDPVSSHRASVSFPSTEVGVPPEVPYVMRDLITGRAFEWTGESATLDLDPTTEPAVILRLEGKP